MFIGVLILIEATAIGIIGILHLIKLYRFERQGSQLQQPKLEKAGRIMAFLGTILIILLPRILDTRYDFSFKGGLVNILMITFGSCVFITGIHFRTTAYKNEEKTPQWIKKLLSLWM